MWTRRGSRLGVASQAPEGRALEDRVTTAQRGSRDNQDGICHERVRQAIKLRYLDIAVKPTIDPSPVALDVVRHTHNSEPWHSHRVCPFHGEFSSSHGIGLWRGRFCPPAGAWHVPCCDEGRRVVVQPRDSDDEARECALLHRPPIVGWIIGSTPSAATVVIDGSLWPPAADRGPRPDARMYAPPCLSSQRRKHS